MDSRLHGVPFSTTMADFSNNALSGIRAPLTVDESDFEYSASPKSRRNSLASSYYSNSELEYEFFEDEPETRTYVINRDEEILEETHISQEYGFHKPSVAKPNGEIFQDDSFKNTNGFPRPSVRNPDEKLAQESGNVYGKLFLGPFRKSPDEEFARKSGSVDGNSFLRALVGDPDEDSSKVISNVNDSDDSRSLLSESGDEFIENEENLEDGLTPIAGITNVPVVQKIHIPIAKISRDSDDDSMGSDASEDDVFYGIAKVPSSEVLQRVNSALKVRILEADEGDDDEPQAEKMEEMEFVKDFVISDSVSGHIDENEHIDGEDIIKCVVLSDTVQDIVPDVNREDILHLGEKNQEFDVPDVEEKCADLVVCSDADLEDYSDCEKLETERELEIERMITDSFSHLEDASSTINESCQNVSLQDIGPNVNKEGILHLDEKNQEFDVPDVEKKFVDLVVCSDAGLEDYVECEDLETERELETERMITDSFSHLEDASSTGNESCRSVMVQDIGPDVNKEDILQLDERNQEFDVPDVEEKCVDFVVCSDTGLEDCVECEKLETQRELEIERMITDSFSRLEVASSTGNESCRSVFEIAKFDQETTNEAENSENSITLSGEQVLLDHSQEIDCQAVAVSECGYIFDSVSDDGSVKLESVNGVEIFPRECNSADLGSIIGSTRPIIEARNENFERMRVTYLQLVDRLGRSPEDFVASNVLRQLSNHSSQAFCLDSAGLDLDAQTKGGLDFSLCILVIGKTGVGKSATINSIFGESKTTVSAFEPSTARVKEIIGKINGVEIKVFDTPGLRTSPIDQLLNRKILSAIKKIMLKSPPDVILYVDRLDVDFSNLNDLPLLKSITTCLGSSIWQKSIIAFTHADLVSPFESDGYPLSYDEFIAHQSRAVRELIGQSTMMDDDSTIPVSLIENDQFGSGEKWRSNLMFLCCSVKILSELSSVVEIDNLSNRLKMFLRYCYFESYNYCDYDGAIVEDNLEAANRLPAVISVRVCKDKKKFDVRLRSSVLALFPVAKAVFDRIFR